METDLDDWLYSLKHLSELEKLPRMLKKPVFERLFDIAAYHNLTDEERMLYDMELQKRWDNKNALDFKLKQGLEQGRREERAKVEADKLESARKMKKAGLPLAQISEFTSLPLDVVEKL